MPFSEDCVLGLVMEVPSTQSCDGGADVQRPERHACRLRGRLNEARLHGYQVLRTCRVISASRRYLQTCAWPVHAGCNGIPIINDIIITLFAQLCVETRFEKRECPGWLYYRESVSAPHTWGPLKKSLVQLSKVQSLRLLARPRGEEAPQQLRQR